MIHRDTITDQLAKVIQVIQLGRRTGTLSVEHGEGSTFEEGLIIFVNGQVSEAKVGHRRGRDAFNWLNTWGMCRFAFTPQDKEQSAPETDPEASHPVPRTPADAKTTKPIPSLHLPDAALSMTPIQVRGLDEAMRFIEAANLSRTHRQIFLLIDGRRTIIELIRLTGRKPHDLTQILNDLNLIGVVHF